MARRKKNTEDNKKPETVQCPIRSHMHKLELVPHPETPGLVVAYCDGRIVYQAPAEKYDIPVSEPSYNQSYHYSVPKLSDSDKGE